MSDSEQSVTEILLEGGESEDIGKRLLDKAVASGVSDIHFDETKETVRVSWRRDGLMENISEMPIEAGVSLARYFKVAADLPPVTAEIPGEGFFAGVGETFGQLSVRVSTIRGTAGTKTSLRILDAGEKTGGFSALGIDGESSRWIREWAEFGSGMLLVTGPTGSGKTTTLYTLLQSLDSRPLNLVSIEDPVERMLPHVTQIDLRLEHELEVVAAMRAILRHDPDLIFVGELRDKKIAKAAMQAAFSGHVIIATMHSHDPAGAITRLRGFGIPDYEIAASLKGVLGQQLIRKSKDKEIWLTPGEKSWLESKGIDALHQVEIRENVEHRYEGRTGIFEWWKVGEDDYYSILNGEDERTLRTNLRERGVNSLFESGLDYVRSGRASIEEIRRLD